MKKKLGFIGCGSMATAIIEGIISAQVLAPNEIMASAPSESTRNKAKNLGIEVSEDNLYLAKSCEYIMLAVKPQKISEVITGIRDAISRDTIILSIAAGVNLKTLSNLCGHKRIIRIMPNTPAKVGEGMSAFCIGDDISKSEIDFLTSILESIGKAKHIDESQMNAVTALSGSGPAYVYMFIEAMADAGVAAGIPREDAYLMAAQTVQGASRMILETGSHPGELKDAVCSPKGTTIAGVRKLEEAGFRAAVMGGIEAAYTRAVELEKNS